MDKETLSNYGWIVICVLVLAVMIALATPFGNFISDAIWSTANGLFSTNNNALDNTLEDLGVVPTPEQLQARYKFEYYSTLNGAVNDVNNGTIGTNADANKDDAVAGIYTNAGQTYVVLLKDTTEATRIQPSVDMTINLGGKKLSANDACSINVLGGNLTIDGRMRGSAVVIERASTAACIQIPTSSVAKSLSVIGGTYFVLSESGNAYTFNIKSETCKSVLSNCNITAEATLGAHVNGVYNKGITTVSNCSIRAYSNYTADGDTYTALSKGIDNYGTLTINDCYVMGTHSGVSNHGTLYVDGGTYEGYGHGGFYFGGTEATAYVRNATIRECPMPDGYIGTAGDNNAGFYIGGATGNGNITVYMDNCDIYGSSQPIVFRGSSGEKNNSLYISNSRINTDKNIRIDNDTHKLYLGTGNNFTADNTNRPSAVITTTETYIQK